MTGARIRIDVDGLDGARLGLRRLVSAARDVRPVFVQIGEYLVGATRDRFRDQKDPDGVPWAPLTEATRSRKPRNKDRILTLHGDLGGQISWRASSAELLVGSDRIYAGTHQFGAKKGQYGTTSRGAPIPWGDIPARPFLGLSDEDRDVIEGMVGDYLSDVLGA